MKVLFKTNGFNAILALFIFTVFAVSCSKSGTKPDPPVVTYIKPAVAIKPAEKITMTTATIVAKVVPNEAGTKVSFQYKEGVSDWNTMSLAQDFSGKDSVTVTSDLINLKSWTAYSFRVVASNKGGDVTSSESKFSTAAVADIDGNFYGAVTIGTQVWMSSDLKTTHYRDGSVIPNVVGNAAWSQLTIGGMCFYNNDSKIIPLYNWYAAIDTRGLAPVGWHVATHAEFVTLRNFLGGQNVAGGKLKETGTVQWKTPNIGATNQTGFTAFPNSIRFGVCIDTSYNGAFYYISGEFATWLSVDSFFVGSVAYLSNVDPTMETGYVYDGQLGAAVRCVKD